MNDPSESLRPRNNAIPPPENLARAQSAIDRLSRRLLALFLIPLLAIVGLGFYTAYLASRLGKIEVLERIATVERTLAQDRNYGWAIAEYTRLASEYRRPEFLVRLAGLSFSLNPADDVEAVKLLQSARSLDAKYWETYGILAYLHLQKGREREAITAGEQALLLNPYDVQTLNNLAWIYVQSKEPTLRDIQRAKRYAEKAVALTKNRNAAYLDTLAEVYFAENDKQQAIEKLRKAVTVSSPENSAHYQRRLDTFIARATE